MICQACLFWHWSLVGINTLIYIYINYTYMYNIHMYNIYIYILQYMEVQLNTNLECCSCHVIHCYFNIVTLHCAIGNSDFSKFRQLWHNCCQGQNKKLCPVECTNSVTWFASGFSKKSGETGQRMNDNQLSANNSGKVRLFFVHHNLQKLAKGKRV